MTRLGEPDDVAELVAFLSSGQSRWTYGTELWEFDDAGLMRRRIASINDAKIAESDRRLR